MLKKKMAAIDIADFHAKVALGKRPARSSVIRLASNEAPVAAQDARVATFTFSDDSVDRYGDTIDARGWDLAAFEANPVALYGHDSSRPEYVIGRAKNVRVDGRRLMGDIEFAEASVNPTAETVYQMVKGGFLNAVSVGFAPQEWALSKDKKRPGGIDFKKQELMEISIVAIPANENALVQARAAGLDVASLGFADRDAPKIAKKGLYEVAWLAQLLNDLGYLADVVEWEAEYEGDGSAVPQMLVDAMVQLGAALLAMTVEEVTELLADDEATETPMIMVDDPTMMAALSPAQKAFAALVRAKRPAVAVTEARIFTEDEIAALKALAAPEIKAGKVLSAASEKSIRDAHATIVKGCDMLKAMVDQPAEDDAADAAKAVRARKARLAAARARAARLAAP